MEGVRRAHPQRLRAPPRLPQRERVRTRQKPRERHRELLVLREEEAGEIQRLCFRRFCATLERVRVEVQPPQRGSAAASQEVVQKHVP